MCVCVCETVSFCAKGQCIRDSRAIKRLVLGDFPGDLMAGVLIGEREREI